MILKDKYPQIGFQEGEKHIYWKGGITYKDYPKEFWKIREEIRERDNHICQECKWTEEQLGEALSVHHIDFNKQNNNPNNLISLCRSCHAKTYNNKEDWINYYQNKIQEDIKI